MRQQNFDALVVRVLVNHVLVHFVIVFIAIVVMMVLVMKLVKFVNWIVIVVALEIAFVIQINIGIEKKKTNYSY